MPGTWSVPAALFTFPSPFPESDRWVFQEVIDSPETLKKMFCEFLQPDVLLRRMGLAV